MKERIGCDDILACTFHSLSYRILSEHRVFTVVDEEDQERIAKKLVADCDILASELIEYINLMKSNGTRPILTEELGRVYDEYETFLSEHNLVDFGGLQMEALPHIESRWSHVLVDEYQDTDPVQFEIVKALSTNVDTLTVVCDEMQSIYGWRGADIDNILRFPNEFKCEHVVLHENYRSTPQIVRVVNKVLEASTEKLGERRLYSRKPNGPNPKVVTLENEYREAEYVVDRILTSGSIDDTMVLYRANWMSRPIEELLSKYSVAYDVVSGISFYRRKEIKDILAYVRLIYNPTDEIAARRIVNVPNRGIGNVTIGKLLDIYGSISSAIWKSPKLVELKYILESVDRNNISRLLSDIVEMTDYEKYISDSDRMKNVESLIDGAASLNCTLDDYMLVISTLTDDNSDERNGVVKLMTIHGAKGMEARNVYLIGCNDDILPHHAADYEEERRLFYVGISRAKENLVITNTRRRYNYGKICSYTISPFIEEIR